MGARQEEGRHDAADGNAKGGANGSSGLSEATLANILERHRVWIGSGWEIGQRASLQHSDLHGRDLRGAVLDDADLHRSDLHRARLENAGLDGADLHRADLHRAVLRGADLGYADLHEADLHGADLRGAVLRAADLHRADLHGAVLDKADLTGADLRGADLRRVRGLKAKQIEVAVVDDATRLPDPSAIEAAAAHLSESIGRLIRRAFGGAVRA